MGVPDVDWLADRVSADMLDQWRRFEESFGPLTVQERVDWSIAYRITPPGKLIRDSLPPWGGSPADDIVGRLEAMSKKEVRSDDDDR